MYVCLSSVVLSLSRLWNAPWSCVSSSPLLQIMLPCLQRNARSLSRFLSSQTRKWLFMISQSSGAKSLSQTSQREEKLLPVFPLKSQPDQSSPSKCNICKYFLKNMLIMFIGYLQLLCLIIVNYPSMSQTVCF